MNALHYQSKFASGRFSLGAIILLRLFTQSKPIMTATNAMNISRTTVTTAAIGT